jgi:lipopolysaccharide transport system ATP-binding protein
MAVDVNTAADGIRLGRLDRPVTIALSLSRIDLEPGSYVLDVGVYESDWAYVYDYWPGAGSLEVRGGGKGFGPERRWRVGSAVELERERVR